MMKLKTKLSLSIFLILNSLFLVFISVGCNAKFKERAQNQINQVEADGCIFVRLRTGQTKIDKLNELGYSKAAKIEEKEVEEENKNIIAGFNEHWDFSKFYFFYSDESLKIKNGQFSEVEFIGKNLKVDSSIKCDCKDGFIVDLSRTSSNILEDSNNSGTVLEGLIVRDRNFKQLSAPFPFLSKKYFAIFKRSISTMVRNLNNDFHRYYKVANKTI